MKEEKKQSKSFSEREEEILKFWEENKIFEKSLEKRARAPRFVFYDGPPFATGLPHYGHILASIIKDAIPRYQTMKGKYVERHWGWDCHGLPLENIIEQELKLKTKKDIEAYGIGKFNRRAEEGVLRYADEWKKVIPRIGRWVDMENDYKTMDWKYSETIWWIFKTLYDKALIYEGHKSMHICPRCETTLANFEVTQGYRDIKDISVTVEFELEDEPNTFILAWTTTPWTLPGNVALAVDPKIDYVKMEGEVPGNTYLIARSRIEAVFGEHYKIIQMIKGSSLVGKKYKPLFDYYTNDPKLENRANGWKIYPADFVTTDEGTGIVHIAPAFGEEDMNLGKEKNLPFVPHISMNGKFKPEVRDFAGLPVKPKGDHQQTDKKIIEYLEKNKKLFLKEEIRHSYPHCWRCDTPLLNYAAVSWFVNVSAIRDDLVKINQKITWVPEHIRDGRFGKWLEGARDWAISRSRFWGAPLPVWRCKKCGKQEVVGSLEELDKKLGGAKNTYFMMRHGESVANVKNIAAVRDGNYPLTPRGKNQVKRSISKLKKLGIDIIVASPILRAKETAEMVGRVLGIKDIIFDDGIREVNIGIFEGKNPREYHNYFSSIHEKFTKRPPEGETLSELRHRALDTVERLEKKYSGKRILIVGHEYSLWMLFAGMEGLTNEEAVDVHLGREEGGFINYGEVKSVSYRNLPRDERGLINIHRPFIDAIRFSCACGGMYERIPEVFDCWFESGSMPYGQWHYPFENKKIFDPKKETGFPADFIAEGLDQTRGWFYSLLVLAVALFGKTAYKNVIVSGIILAEDGQKMSKRLKNYPDPMEVVSKFGADSIRFHLLSSSAVYGEDLNFSVKEVDEVYKKYVMIARNVLNFFLLYRTELKKTAPRAKKSPKWASPSGFSPHVLDQWILSRLNSANREVTEAFENYTLHCATKELFDFVQDLSLWYVRRSRERMKANTPEGRQALDTLQEALLGFSRMSAPITPFLAEMIFREVSDKKIVSVHLEGWPKVTKGAIQKTLEKDMQKIREIVSTALRLRADAGIRVRQPLGELRITNYELRNKKELLMVLGEEVNVKKITFGKDLWLDTAITPELKEEGIAREIVRNIQEMRKERGLTPKDTITLAVTADAEMRAFFGRWEKQIIKDTRARGIQWEKTATNKSREISFEGGSVRVGIL